MIVRNMCVPEIPPKPCYKYTRILPQTPLLVMKAPLLGPEDPELSSSRYFDELQAGDGDGRQADRQINRV